MNGNLIKLTSKEATDFILPRHYSGRKPQITIAYGLEIGGQVVAAATFGKPATPTLCNGICGKEYAKYVYELNRLIRLEEYDEYLSEFVAMCLKDLKKNNWIIVSYSDTGMGHNGYIYQACNFLYTGKTKQRTDRFVEEGKHSRHCNEGFNEEIRQVRTSKHRYVYFACDKRMKRVFMKNLKYPIMPYPKGENRNYVLGTYYKQVLVDKNGNVISDNENRMEIERGIK